MTIEAKLDSIDATLKLILTSLQSGAAVAAPAAAAPTPEPTEKKPRAAKTKVEPEATVATAPVVDGDPAGTRYWDSAEHRQVYAELPGTQAPADQSFKITTAADYLVKKAEYAAAGNAQPAVKSEQPAASEPSATQPAATASGEVSWKEHVFPAIQALNRAKGADAIRALISHFGLSPKTADNPTGATVPALEALGKHAEVIDAANKLANGLPLTAAGDDLGL